MHIAESWAFAAYSHLKKSRCIGTKRGTISSFVFADLIHSTNCLTDELFST